MKNCSTSFISINTLFAVILSLSVACHAYADGVTIVTHGWNPSIAGMPIWLESIQNAISDNHLDTEKNFGKITVTKPGEKFVVTCDPWDIDLTSGSSGEILIILDWSTIANHLIGGPAVQDIAAIVIDYIVNNLNGNAPPLSELPIHLIGHSRGGGMVCEIARLLGEKGILVDHLTPLDPHPLTVSDPQPILSNIIDTPTAIYENVLFADVYRQNTEYPTGELISGAYNRTWGTMAGGYYDNGSVFPNHRNIYLMYQGTVDLNNPVDNGEASMNFQERLAWFTSEESNGDQSGFCFSRIKGTIDRKKNGLHENILFGGTGVRQNLMWSEAVWPNIADLQVRKEGSALGHGRHTISIDSELDLRYVALDYDSSSTVTLHVDSDRNPYNNNDLASINDPIQHIATNDIFIEKSVKWDTSGMSHGSQAYIYTKISDGFRTRYFYAPACLVFSDSTLDSGNGTNDVALSAIIKTEEAGNITAVWKKGGEDTTSRGDRVVWGYFYADPNDVSWGSINNPEVFVKVWYDAGGRVDVNFFHVSVPDIEVSATYNDVDLQATATTTKRYIRHYYNDNAIDGTSENTEDGIPVTGYTQKNSPVSYPTINNLNIGAMINTVEAVGSIDALWVLGGTDTTSRGDQVVWGYFYADPNEVSWGSKNNPELFVKIWFDAGGRIDVNYFHVSVPDIEVYSDYGSDGIYDNKGTTIMDDRYIRHEYTKN